MTTTVTTTEFRRNIDVYSKTARSEPVVITGEDRDELVLIAAEDYEKL